jgi:hypothetical protein
VVNSAGTEVPASILLSGYVAAISAPTRSDKRYLSGKIMNDSVVRMRWCVKCFQRITIGKQSVEICTAV